MMTLNFGENHIEVPIGIGIAVILIAVIPIIIFFVCLGREEIEKWFICDKCGHRFKPEDKKVLFSIRMNNERMLKCPRCGKVSFCYPSYDQSDDKTETEKQHGLDGGDSKR